MIRARPLLLLDIDGVLNVYGVEACPDGYREYDLFPEDDDPTRLAMVHGDWLTELGGVFDLVWASAWGIQANELIVSRARRWRVDDRAWRCLVCQVFGGAISEAHCGNPISCEP